VARAVISDAKRRTGSLPDVPNGPFGTSYTAYRDALARLNRWASILSGLGNRAAPFPNVVGAEFGRIQMRRAPGNPQWNRGHRADTC